jgi:hypothetical protein
MAGTVDLEADLKVKRRYCRPLGPAAVPVPVVVVR